METRRQWMPFRSTAGGWSPEVWARFWKRKHGEAVDVGKCERRKKEAAEWLFNAVAPRFAQATDPPHYLRHAPASYAT